MFENVIVGVDGRTNGRDAIALAWRLLAEEGKLTLANVHGGASHPLHAATPGRLPCPLLAAGAAPRGDRDLSTFGLSRTPAASPRPG